MEGGALVGNLMASTCVHLVHKLVHSLKEHMLESVILQ